MIQTNYAAYESPPYAGFFLCLIANNYPTSSRVDRNTASPIHRLNTRDISRNESHLQKFETKKNP